MDWHCSVRTQNKILHNEAQNKDEYMTTWCLSPRIPRNRH